MDAQEALIRYFHYVPRVARDISWIMGWDENKTVVQNCKDLKIPNSPTGHNLCYKFQLGFREGFHRVVKTDKESIQILINNGLNMADIARLIGVSHQRIEQILKGRKRHVKAVKR